MRIFLLLLTAVITACTLSCTRREGVRPEFATLINGSDTANIYDSKGLPAPDAGCTRMRVRSIGPIGKAFSDINSLHLGYAHRLGIKPIASEHEAWFNGKGLTEVKSTPTYYVDSLTHSYPYLVPEAKALLDTIGRRFADSLAARGGGAYRLKVTSILRSPMTVGKLRRVNRNATGESAHQYGTTFDISHSKFICDDTAGVRRTFEDLKNLLAEVIFDLRAQGRCMVKHERKQACFHITVTDDSLNIIHSAKP